MSSEFEYVQRLVRLKRYEQPDERFYEDFVDQVRLRREAEETGKRLGPSMGERLGDWFDHVGSKRWLYGSGLAYATIMIGVFFNTSLRSDHLGSSDVVDSSKSNATVIPVVKLSSDSEGNSMLKSSKDVDGTKKSSAKKSE